MYQALHEHDLLPDWIIGASIGAVNGALIAGSVPARRLETLRSFWRPTDFGNGQTDETWFPAFDVVRRTTAAIWTLAAGRPGIFGPLLSSLNPWTDPQPSIFETSQLTSTLSQLIDFDELNSGDCRFTATAVDLETGDDVVFDSRNRHINPVGGEDESRTSIDGNDDHRHDDQKPATGAGKNSADVTEDDPHKVEKLTKAGRDIDPDEGAD